MEVPQSKAGYAGGMGQPAWFIKRAAEKKKKKRQTSMQYLTPSPDRAHSLMHLLHKSTVPDFLVIQEKPETQNFFF